MRRTALLVSATLLTGPAPVRRGGPRLRRGRSRPRARRPLRGRDPLREPARRGHLHLGQRHRRPAHAGAHRPGRRPRRARRSSPVRTTSAATAASPTTSPSTSRPTTGPRTEGIRFWWDGRNNGKKIDFELKDGGANGEASELWTTSFTDDFDRLETARDPLHRLHLPHRLPARRRHRPDPRPDRDVGLRAHPPGRRHGPLRHGRRRVVRQGRPVAARRRRHRRGRVPGRRRAAPPPSGSPSPPPAPPRSTTPSPSPTRRPTGTADPGKDYTPVDGTLTFPAGTASGDLADRQRADPQGQARPRTPRRSR